MTEKRDSYYQRATTWAVDEQASLRTMLRQTRIFSGAIVLIAIFEAFALLLLIPLKTVKSIPVLVDRQTGFVEVLKDDGRQDLRADAALTQSLLAQYVVARESFDISDIAAEYHKVALWSGGDARQKYVTTMPATNPQSPFRIYPRSTIVDTRIKSISPLGQNVALVRFETRRQDQDGRATVARAWAAVVAYRFIDAPMSVEDRLANPLGFQVVRYHRDAETVIPPEPAEIAPVGSSASASAKVALSPTTPASTNGSQP